MKKKVKLFFVLLCMVMAVGMGSICVMAGTVVQNISVNATYDGQLKSYNDVRQYNFTLTKAGRVNVTFAHANISSTSDYWVIEIYDLNQECLMRMKSAGTETSKVSTDVGLPAGSYYVQVAKYNYYNSAGYSLKVNYVSSDYWEKESNDGYGSADEIAVNTSYSGANQFYDDKDYYKFTLNSAGKISIDFQHPILHDNNTYWKVSIYNEQTEHLLELDAKGTASNITSAELGLEAGDYYVFIEPYTSYYYNQSTYTFKVNYAASDYWEKEVNNGYGSADEIALNVSYSGVNQFYNDKDYYKFTLDSAGKVSINFQHPILQDNNTYWKVGIYNEQTEHLLELDVKGTASNITSAEMGLAAGDYYVFIEPYTSYYYNQSTYTFKVNHTASDYWEKEANDGYGTADTIELNTSYSGANQFYDDKDYYKFTLDGTRDVKVNFKHAKLNDNACYWEVYLYNASAQTLMAMDINGMETNVSSDTISLSAGTYYIYVTARSSYYHSTATYTLSVDDSYTTSQPILKLASQAYNKIKISWNRYGNASGYVVYRSTSRNGTYKAIRTITNNNTKTYTDTSVKAGKIYYYCVRPYKTLGSKKNYGSYSAIIKAKAAPKSVKISSVKAGAKKAAITWKKQSNVSGYEIYMASSKNGKYTKVKTITKANVCKYTKTKLTRGRTYYFKVRAYQKVNSKKVYGDFSSIKAVRITK